MYTVVYKNILSRKAGGKIVDEVELGLTEEEVIFEYAQDNGLFTVEWEE